MQRDVWATGRRPYMESSMKYDPTKHHRRSIRLPGYDYASPGAYFVTIVTYHHACLFGKIQNNEMQLTNMGQTVEEHWRDISEHFPNVELGTFVVMPNHIHGIIILHADAIRDLVSTPEILHDHSRRGVVSTPEILHDHPCRGVVSTPEILHNNSRSGMGSTPIFTDPQGDETSPLQPIITVPQGDVSSPLQRPTLGKVVAYFKYQSTKQINTILDSAGTPIWQRNFVYCVLCSAMNISSVMNMNTKAFIST
jgi:REP element-mobilizing transposase RayT